MLVKTQAKHLRPPYRRSSTPSWTVWCWQGLHRRWGLVAGVFYAYGVAMMHGLDRVDRTLVDGIQEINEAIENPVWVCCIDG
jgi:hypothetical protein